MEIHLSRRRTLSEQQRRKKILDPSNLNQTFNGKKCHNTINQDPPSITHLFVF